MCCHQLYIYDICGHCTFGPRPLIECPAAGIAPDAHRSSKCELTSHPYRSTKVERLCPACKRRRDSMLDRLERCQHVEYDEYKWKVSYAMPAQNH